MWGPIVVPAAMPGDFQAAAETALSHYRGLLSDSGRQLDEPGANQLAAALAAAQDLVNAGLVGQGPVTATLSGHSSGANNWSGVGNADSVNVSVQAADQVVYGGNNKMPANAPVSVSPDQSNAQPAGMAGSAPTNTSPVNPAPSGNLTKTPQEVTPGGVTALDAAQQTTEVGGSTPDQGPATTDANAAATPAPEAPAPDQAAAASEPAPANDAQQ